MIRRDIQFWPKAKLRAHLIEALAPLYPFTLTEYQIMHVVDHYVIPALLPPQKKKG